MSLSITNVTALAGLTHRQLVTFTGPINSLGAVVGSSSTGATDHAVLWQNGAATDLGTLPGDAYSSANGINDLGQIVGISSTGPFDLYHGVLWQNGTVTAIGTLGGSYSEALAVNNQGQIVGDSTTLGGLDEAFIWQNGVMTNLGTLPGGASANTGGAFNSGANAINDHGQVVGESLVTGNIDHAFLWQNGVMTDLGVLSPGSMSVATAINNNGQVAGYNSSGTGVTHAVSWQNGVITDLGTVLGYDYSQAQAINDSGIIVGYVASTTSNATSNHAVVWRNGVITDLNSLLPAGSGWILNDATGINDNGQISGEGTLNGLSTAFELTLGQGATSSASALMVQNFHDGAMTVPAGLIDSAANVMSSLDGLEAVAAAGKLSSITLTDGGTPTITVTATQAAQDAAALSAISGSYHLAVSGAATTAIGNFLADQDDAGRGANGVGADYAGVAPAGGNSVIGFQSANLTSGVNAMVLDGPRSQYAIAVAANGTVTVTDTTTHQTVTDSGLAYIVFDGAATTTTNGVTGYSSIYFIDSGSNAQIASLYQGVLGRQPDLPGLEYWQHQMASGAANLNQVAGAFRGSGEFLARFPTASAPADHGGPNDSAFVIQLYQNILNRAPDAGGQAFWDGQLASGAMNRTQVVLSFTGSPENMQDVGAAHGGWLIDPATGGYADAGAPSVIQVTGNASTTILGGVSSAPMPSLTVV